MTTDHEHLRRSVLVLEDLGGEERALVEAHLADCPACARLRERILAAESRWREVPELSAAEDPLGALSDSERSAALGSREALLAAVASGGRRRAPSWPRLMPLALAALAAFVVLMPGLARRGPVRDLRLGSPLVMRGPANADGPYGVSFRLARAGFPVLLHVDAGGAVRLLFPLPGQPADRVAADVLVLLPPPEGEDAWRSGLTPGCGTYLLSVATERPPTAGQLATLAEFPKDGEPRAAAREASRRLRETIGAVRRLDDEGCH